MIEIANVPCNGCVLCCVHQLVPILAEEGDDPAQYDCVEQAGMLVLRTNPDGSCVYLRDGGCTIHERAPVLCRSYDCRRDYQMHNRAERRRRIAMGLASSEIYEAGRQRLNSLERRDFRAVTAKASAV